MLVFAFLALTLLLGVVLMVFLRRRFAAGRGPIHACAGKDLERTQLQGGGDK